jgi:hypothetical protein
MRFIFLFSVILFTGCVTMLPQIKDEFLAGKTKEQEEVLFKLEDQIVEINKQKSGIEKKINISRQLIKVNDKEYPFLKDKLNYYNESQELYILTNNSAKMAQTANDLKKIELDIKLNLLMNEYLSVMRNFHQSSLDLNYAELSAKIAELSYEKSKIAAAYIDSKTARPDAAAETDPKKQKVENKNPINVNDYLKQFDERKKNQSDKKTTNENYLIELNKAEKKIRDEGFTINPEFVVK